MKFAYVKGDVAQDVVEVDPFNIFRYEYAALFVEVPGDVEIGWVIDESGKWTAPQAIVIVPQEITPLQGLLALDKFGMAATYEAWAADPARTFAERAFITRAQTWRRNDPTLLAAASAFNLTPEQLDALFIEGAQL